MSTCGQSQLQRMPLSELQEKATTIRRLIVEAFVKAGHGHYGGCLSEVEILTALYFRVMNVNSKEPRWPDRDRLVLSKGHGAVGLCATLAYAGFFPTEMVYTYDTYASRIGLHPDMHKVPGVDMSTGSLGLGIAAACGMAIACKVDRKPWKVYTLVGDGECDEGIVWEAAMFAHHHKLDNLVAIIDRNMLSMDGPTEEIMSLEPLPDKWRVFGWAVRVVDGHDIGELVDALESTPFEKGKPSMIIARTVKGKGISFMEGKVNFHRAVLTPEQAEQAKREVGLA